MKKMIIFMTIYSSLIFTTISNVINLGNKSLIYAIFILLIAMASIILVVIDYIKLNKIRFGDLMILGIPIFMLLLIMFSISKYQLNEFSFNMVLQYISLCIPAFLMGFYVKKFSEQSDFYNITFFLNVVTTLVLFYSYLTSPTDYRGYFYNFGESSHLFIGYTSGIFLIYNIISLINKKDQNEGSKKIKNIIKLGLIIMQFWLIIGSGSRGALFAVVGTIIIYIMVVKNVKGKKIFLFLVVLFIAFIIALEIDESFRNGIMNFTKVFSFNDSFIDIGSSKNGRDIQYKLAIDLFEKNPIFGVGVLGYNSITNLPYPHNILLELLSNYGLIITIPIILLIFFSLKKNINSYNYASSHIYIILIFIYNIIAMQLSYSLLTNSYFWFGLAYCLTDKYTRSHLHDNKEGYF